MLPTNRLVRDLMMEASYRNGPVGSGPVGSGAADANARQGLVEREMTRAVHENELRLYFQPVCSAHERRITGFEALLRWQHPRYGLLGPDSFLALAEDRSVRSLVTEWVALTGLRHLKSWHRAGYDLGLALNVAPADLSRPAANIFWAKILAELDTSPAHLTLEITERSRLMGSADVSVLKQLRRMGMGVAVDDFGTGFSTLQMLADQSFTQIKVDKVFAGRAAVDEYARLVTETAVTLAHKMGLTVVAEGVEDLPTAALLEEIGCDFLQGFVLGRPMPEDQLWKWVEAWGSEAPLP